MKKFLIFFLFGIIFLLTTSKAMAESQPDLDKNGSIEITMRDSNGNLVIGGSVEIYKVADVNYDNQGFMYVYTAEFATAGYALEKIGSLELVSELNNYVVDNGIQGVLYDNADGKLKIDDLTAGLYLISPKSAPNGYKAIVPFLVSVPYKFGDNWVYEVDATPKMSPLNQETIAPEPDTEVLEPDTEVLETTTGSELPNMETSLSNSENSSANTEGTETGDTTQIMIYVVMMCVAAIVGGICVEHKRKKG